MAAAMGDASGRPPHACSVRWEQIGDEVVAYWADDGNIAHPDDGRVEIPEDAELARGVRRGNP